MEVEAWISEYVKAFIACVVAEVKRERIVEKEEG